MQHDFMSELAANKHPSILEAYAIEFGEKFQEQLDDLKKSCQSNSVSASFFCKNGDSRGFLADLIDCFKENGISGMSSYVKPELTQSRTLPIENFLHGIASLSKDKLQTLKNFYQKMEGSKNGESGYFPPEYRKISSYFSSQNKANNDSAEAGRLVLTLSSLGGAMLDMKRLFETYVPLTIGKIQNVYQAALKEINQTLISQTDDVRTVIDLLLNKFKDISLPLAELQRSIAKLNKQKREFLQFLIFHSKKIGEKTGDKLNQAKRHITTWRDWEVIMKSDKNAEKSIENQLFSKALSEFKQDLNQKMQLLLSWVKKIQSSIHNKENICSYFYQVICEIEESITKSFDNKIFIEPGLRIGLKKILYLIKNIKNQFSSLLYKEEKELQQFPEKVQQRLSYFSREVPEVLLRSNPAEVKYMTLAINASYRNVENNLRALMGKDDDQTEKLSKTIRSKYTEIVKNATILVRMHS